MSSLQSVDRKKNPLVTNFESICNKRQLSEFSIGQLDLLREIEIVFVCNDGRKMNRLELEVSSRWDRLKRNLRISIELATLRCHHGIDVYFFNRPPVKNLQFSTLSKLDLALKTPPRGRQTMNLALQTVIADKLRYALERRLLILACTTDQIQDFQIETLLLHNILVLSNPSNQVRLSVLPLPRDEPLSSELPDEWASKIRNLNLCKDYRVACHDVVAEWGQLYPFSYGDYLCQWLCHSSLMSI